MRDLQPQIEAARHRMQMWQFLLQRPPPALGSQLRVQPQKRGEGEISQASHQGRQG